jgi:hypothetical protein
MVEIKEVSEEPKKEVKNVKEEAKEEVKNVKEEVKNMVVHLTRANCVEIGRSIEQIVLLMHPQSNVSYRARANEAFGKDKDGKPFDVWTAFDYEAQFLFLRCGMTYKTLSMIRQEQIHYVALESDVKMRFIRGFFQTCCIKCEKKCDIGKKEGDKTFIFKNPNAGVVLEGFPFYTFNNLQFLCSEECWKKLEEEIKRVEPKKIPPPPKSQEVPSA